MKENWHPIPNRNGYGGIERVRTAETEPSREPGDLDAEQQEALSQALSGIDAPNVPKKK